MKDKAKLPSIAVIGGDKRARYIAKMLAEDGFEVGTALLGCDPEVREVSVGDALKCDVVILPTPATKDGENLFAPESEDKDNLVDIISGAREGTLLLGGNLGESAVNSASLRGVRVRDYFSRDGVAEANAVPTAEGALAIAMQNSDITVSGSRCLVIGCGRCGRALARLLRGCDADVTVSSRKRKDRFWTRANGCHTVNTGEIAEKAEEIDEVYFLNDQHLKSRIDNATRIFVAWGGNSSFNIDFYNSRIQKIKSLLEGKTVYCYKKNQNGTPIHPSRNQWKKVWKTILYKRSI